MKRILLIINTVLLITVTVHAQDTLITNNTGTILSTNKETVKWASPYKTSFKVDAPIIVAGLGLTGLGVSMIQKIDPLTPEQLAKKTKDKVPFFDRSSAGYYSKRADEDSYIPFQASFTFPIILSLINKNERHKIGQVYTMYLETMAITGAMFTVTAASAHRSRPYVYGDKASLDKRLSEKGQRAFYAGHTAATAAASFFAAKVFADFNPDSKLKPYIWGVAIATPAVVGYLRYKAGMHFLSDNVLGYALGAATGILVPHFHKKKILNSNVSITPTIGTGYKGMAMTYRF